MGEADYQEIFFTYDPVEATILADLLRSGGIEVVERSNRVSPYPVNVGRMGESRLLVRGADAQHALELVRHFEQEREEGG